LKQAVFLISAPQDDPFLDQAAAPNNLATKIVVRLGVTSLLSNESADDSDPASGPKMKIVSLHCRTDLSSERLDLYQKSDAASIIVRRQSHPDNNEVHCDLQQPNSLHRLCRFYQPFLRPHLSRGPFGQIPEEVIERAILKTSIGSAAGLDCIPAGFLSLV